MSNQPAAAESAALPAWRVLVTTTLPFVALAVVLLALAYLWLDPTPPRRVVMATGVAQGAYSEFGKRYAAAAWRSTASKSNCATPKAQPRTWH